MKTKLLLSSILFLFSFLFAFSQDENESKTGWSFGAVPVVGGDTDVGFKYGGLVNFYDYGDGSKYPGYDHSLYFEWSRTTKGSGINQFTYDSEKLIPGLRTSGEISYLTEKALDFYGFNGYESYYNGAFVDDEAEDLSEYQSRLFYKNSRQMFRAKLEFQGSIIGEKLRWFAGVEYYNQNIDTVDTPDLNDGKDVADQAPYVDGGLYGRYIRFGLLPEDQINGGSNTLIKAGLVYDTRDNEPNPMKGIWTELQFIAAPGFLGSGDYGYTRMALTHRQYFTLIPKVMNFAYRISYQAKLSGDMPFYMLPFIFNTAPKLTYDGLGGSKSMRGILRNRVVGEDFFYGNAELRYKIIRTKVLNQNLYVALTGFVDGGIVTGQYELEEFEDLPSDPLDVEIFENDDEEGLHLSFGPGFHVALNENFIVSLDYGFAADKRDGNTGFYVTMNFLF